MKFHFSALTALVISSPATNAFTANGPSSVTSRNANTGLRLAPEALTEYMAKAHEDKLNAVKAAEAKKDAEIQVIPTKTAIQDFFYESFFFNLNSFCIWYSCSSLYLFLFAGFEKSNARYEIWRWGSYCAS